MMPLFETSQSPEINNGQELDEFRRAFRDTKCIIDKVQEAIFVYDQGGRLLEINQTALTLHQLTYEQAIRELSIEELAISGSRWESRSELWQATSQTEKLTFDWRRTSNDGLLVLEMVAQIIVLGEEPCLMICAHEVTKRKQLEEQQRRLLALIEATPDLVGMVDSTGKILYLNQAGREMLKTSGTNLEERYIYEIMPAQYTERFASTILPHAIEKGHWSGDATFEMTSGQAFPVSQVLVSHKDELGDVQYLSTIIRDVSETKASEAKLRDREQFLNSIYCGADIVIFAWDLIDEQNGVFISSGWNPTCEAATGMSADTVLGRTPAEVFGPEQGAQVTQNFLRCVSETISISYEEKIVFNGSPTWWATKLTPVKNESGKPYRVVGTTTNITDLKQKTIELEAYSHRQVEQTQQLSAALTELKQTQAQIVHSEKMSSLGQMVAGIAHEINNPVNFIHANIKPAVEYAVDLLELISAYQEEFPEISSELQACIEEIDLEFVRTDFMELLNSMKLGTQRIREIVVSLRNFARLDEAEVKGVNIQEGIDSTLTILRHRLKANRIQRPISVTKDYQLTLPVECYPSQLNQVVMNILSNAIDALDRHENPQLRITTYQQDRFAIITLADNGPGIPNSAQKNIFDPFFTTKPVGKGTGMGLSISYQIITEKHGGTLSVESTPGEGTQFTIKIPLTQSES